MTPQSSLTIVAPIAQGKTESLRELLHSMNTSGGIVDPENPVIPFHRFLKLHYARFVILEDNTADDIKAFGEESGNWTAKIAFLCDLDGSADNFLAELAVIAEPGLVAIFSHCEHFRGNEHSILNWLTEHRIDSAANYINTMGRTVLQAHENIILHDVLSKKLRDIQASKVDMDLNELRKQLLDHIAVELHAGGLKLSKPEKTPVLWFIGNLFHKFGVPLLLLMLSPVIALIVPFYLIRLRQLEKSDPEIFKRPEAGHVGLLTAFEDYDVTNQFSAFGQLKPQWFRQQSARFFLWLLNYSARHVYNRGFLTRVQTIHFARWIFLDKYRYMLFASNYDGSEESYMDDFVNKVAWGLNLVFSNGVGYPTTNWLIKDGAKREEVYKAFLRRRQLPTECWYKAYPGKTAFDLQRNDRIREGVENRPRNRQELKAWLALIQAGAQT